LKNFWYVILVIVLALLVLFFITNPEIIKNIWLWLIGFAGGIAGLFRNVFNKLNLATNKPDTEDTPESQKMNQNNIEKSKKRP
jgi:Sec-independent protein translocase protein TatA